MLRRRVRCGGKPASEDSCEDVEIKGPEVASLSLEGVLQARKLALAHVTRASKSRSRDRARKAVIVSSGDSSSSCRAEKKGKKHKKKRKKKEKEKKKAKPGKKVAGDAKQKRAGKQKRRSKQAPLESSSSSSSCRMQRAGPGASSQLAEAIEQGNFFLAQHLIMDLGVGWKDSRGNSSLHMAARRSFVGLVGWLLRQPGSRDLLDHQNLQGETALLLAVKSFRGTVALRLVEALADPAIADARGETAEGLDLDGLLRETEAAEEASRLARTAKALAAVEAARKAREEVRWRERLFEEMRADDCCGAFVAGYEDLELRDASSGGRHWMDEIAMEVERRRRNEARMREAERLRAEMRAKKVARQEAEAQEARAREAAKEDAKRCAAGFKGPLPRNVERSAAVGGGAEAIEEARIAARAADDRRWRTFEARLAELAPGAPAGPAPASSACRGATGAGPPQLRCSEIPWPSGPPGNPLRVDPEGHPALLKSQLRTGLLRWHPDKFAQRVAGLTPEGDAKWEAALHRVKEIAQQLNRLMSELAAAPSGAERVA